MTAPMASLRSPTEASAELGRRFLVLAPVGNDATVTAKLLAEAKIAADVCPDLTALLAEIDRGCAGLIVAEEALGEISTQRISDKLRRQPSWSDLPILIITTRGEPTTTAQRKLLMFGPAGNVSLLERPFRPLTIINAAQVALRARERQYQVGDLLQERERILSDLERTVELRTAELRDTNAQLEEFVYSIAHDLRAPLRSMQGFSSLLVEQYGERLTEEGRSFAQRVIRSAEAMDAITLDLLAYGRIARSEVILAPTDVETAWNAALLQCEKNIEESNASINTQRPLPLVCAQSTVLAQVLANLLSNALKFVRPGIRPEIAFWSEQTESSVRLWISDNGIGIQPKHKERIFRVFERLDGAKYPGTGIGLSIVRRGIERMGGQVGVESEPGSGSRFWIELSRAFC